MKHAAFHILVWLLMQATAWSQYEYTDYLQPGKIGTIKCTLEAEEGGGIGFEWFTNSNKLDIVPSESGRILYVTSMEKGTYKVVSVVARSKANGKLWMEKEEITLFVGTAPAPTPVTLQDLATPGEAAILSEFYQDFAANLIATPLTAEQFWQVHDSQFALLQIDNPKLEESLYALLRTAVKDIDSLPSSLVAISLEFSTPPEPVPDDPVVQPTPDEPDEPIVTPIVKPTAVTYVYEQRDTVVPVGVKTGLNRLNREKGVRATLFDKDSVDDEGQVPDQYKAALQAAQRVGLPALVATKEDLVIEVIKDPRTEQQVWGMVP